MNLALVKLIRACAMVTAVARITGGYWAIQLDAGWENFFTIVGVAVLIGIATTRPDEDV